MLKFRPFSSIILFLFAFALYGCNEANTASNQEQLDYEYAERIGKKDFMEDSDLFRIWGTKYVFNVSKGWANTSESWSNEINKFHRFSNEINGRIHGSIRVARDIYHNDIFSIKNLDSSYEKSVFIDEASRLDGALVRDFSFQKISIQERDFFRIQFTQTLPIEGLEDWTCLFYKTLFVNGLNEEFIINFSLITPTINFISDKEHFESMILSIREDNELSFYNFNKQSGSRRFKIPLIENYIFYKDSPFSDKSIYEFTGAGCSPLEVDILDALIPKNYWEYNQYPIINIHTFRILSDEIVTVKSFSEYRKEWLINLGDGTAEKIMNGRHPLSSDCLLLKNELSLNNYAILINSDSIFSYILFVESMDGNNQLIQTDHLLLKGTIITIRYNIQSKSLDNFETFLAINKNYSNKFKNLNKK